MIVAAVNAKDRFYIEKDILSGPYMTTCDPFLRSIGTVYNTIVANYLWPIYFLRYLELFLVATKWFIDNRYNKQVFWCSCGNSNMVTTLTKSFTNTFVYHYGYLFLPKKNLKSSAFDRTAHFEIKLFNKNFHTESTQQAITSSKLTVKTPEQSMKYIQSYR